MKKFACFCRDSCNKVACFLDLHFHPLWIQLSYFLIVSLLGCLALTVSKPRTTSFRPKFVDVFFTSVSATTTSSMSTVEMEVFSNTQLIIMTILMFVGGEVFISMLGLQFARSKFPKNHQSTQVDQNRATSTAINVNPISQIHNNLNRKKELDLKAIPRPESEKPNQNDVEQGIMCLDSLSLEYNSVMALGYVVLGYLLVVILVGSSSVFLYISLDPTARTVLKNKGLDFTTFSVFSVVSSFTNCGFIPTNENLMVFKKNSGLLLLLISQILMGNTLYPPCLLFVIWVLKKTSKRAEFSFILRNYRDMGYSHLLSLPHAALLFLTVFGFISIAIVLFCCMEWNSDAMDDLNSYQKLVGSLNQAVNARHAGESVFDLSSISPAILLLFIVMMYLPPYTTFLPTKYQDDQVASENGKGSPNRRKQTTFMECLMLSQLSYLVLFIILICVTERQKMKEDPLNFSVLNIILEVISAYGNVGYSTGYSCKRQVKPDSSCTDTWYGFVGRWSTKGKIILIIVMFFGKLKKFTMKGGKAWKLS
ncbi:hypothetical protein F2P56_034661 [Juglans regia]|uniref:Sodium transporter HKT1-like n=2 Tax=Juglans regia TaxID=51240 RepID=A0A833U2K5_JUGRE|nr:sodium transporter HKT1 [Juglans regia]KAF5445619.1 hypothetical protein F2P56_034661 [Juglans regia]